MKLFTGRKLMLFGVKVINFEGKVAYGMIMN